MKTNLRFLWPLKTAAMFIAVTAALTSSPVLAASTAIGLAVAKGGFQVDRAQVWGSSSLFEGNTVQTTVTGSQIQVNGGADVRLASDTRVKVYRSKMVLEEGFMEVRAANGFAVEARSLAITPKAREGVTRIKLQGARKVTVAALSGSVEVKNGSGVLVARVGAGMSLDFEPQTAGTQTSGGGQTATGASGSSTSGASGSAGAEASQSGTTGTAAGASGSTASGASGASGTAGATAAGAGASAGGISAGTIAIIGGVAVAATLGGLAATGSLPGQGQSSPSASQ